MPQIPSTSDPVLRRGRVPKIWQREISSVLISETRLRKRVHELAEEITRDHADSRLVVVSLLSGSAVFMADLIRRIPLPIELDFMAASSYGMGTVPREISFTKDLKLSIKGRNVLLLDDIIDSGHTLWETRRQLRALHPRRISTCVLLDKPARRERRIQADYSGFTIPDLFVVGYGMDHAERYRNLPFIGLLHPSQFLQAP